MLPLALLACLGLAQDPLPAEVHAPARQEGPATAAAARPVLRDLFDRDRFLVFDRDTAGGPLWAAGCDFKVAFERGGYRFYGRPDERTTAAEPIAFRLQRVQVGSTVLRLHEADPEQHGERVDYRRGGLVESVLVTPRGIEQVFTFDQLPERGELSVAIAVDTALAVFPHAGGLRFSAPHQEVTYSQAVAIDARGAWLLLPTVGEGELITITVPAEFVAGAALPLRIDPVINSLQLVAGVADLGEPDIAWDEQGAVWAIAFQRLFAANDWDCYVQRVNNANPMSPVGALTPIDISNATWQFPRIANLRVHGVFIIVGQTRLSSSPWAVSGRTMANNGVTTGSGFLISDPQFEAMRPDVGGSSTLFGYFTVVWERVMTPNVNHDIVYRQVEVNGTLRPGPWLVHGGAQHEINPSISRSCGGVGTPTRRYGIVFQQRNAVGQYRIMGALMTWDGTMLSNGQNSFPLTSGSLTASDINPRVSSPTLPGSDGRRLLLAVYERPSVNNGDIGAVCFDHMGTIIAMGNISELENNGLRLQWPQREPAVDCDGMRFVVAYHEVFSGSIPTNDLDTRVSVVVPSNGSFLLPEAGLPMAYTTNREFRVQVASRYSGSGLFDSTSGIVNDRDNINGSFAIDIFRHDSMPPSGMSVRATGCGNLGISGAGQPYAGQTLTFTLTSGGAPTLFLAGVPIPPTLIPACPQCRLGVDGVTLDGPTLSIAIPLNPGLLGARLSVQGVSLDASGPCFGLLHFSNTWDALIL